MSNFSPAVHGLLRELGFTYHEESDRFALAEPLIEFHFETNRFTRSGIRLYARRINYRGREVECSLRSHCARDATRLQRLLERWDLPVVKLLRIRRLNALIGE